MQCPGMRSAVAERAVGRYVDSVMAELAHQYPRASRADLAQAEIDFAAERVMHACKQVSVEGRQVRVWPLMQRHPSTRLVHVVYQGNSLSGRVSRVTFNPLYRRHIMDELKSLSIELDPARLQALEDQANSDQLVDVASLDSFLKHTRRTLNTPDLPIPYADALLRNLMIGNELRSRVRSLDDGRHCIAEHWEEIDSGRIYGHGLSLQRQSKEVRHAALGPCHKYDFKACSFALMTSLALQIQPDLPVAAIKDYIRHRAAIRKRLAAHLNISPDRAKGIFTALGFGAELKNNPHHAIRGQLGADAYERLLQHDEFAAIASQLKAVSAVIDKAFPRDGFEFFGRTYSPTHPKTGAKRTKNQKLAWIYQCMEAEALRQFVELADAEPLLTAHDCVYFKTQLPPSKTQDIAHLLAQQFELLRFEHEAVTPIHAVEEHCAANRAVDSRERQHRESIARQDQLAQNYHSPHVGSPTCQARSVCTPWGEIDADVWALAQNVGLGNISCAV